VLLSVGQGEANDAGRDSFPIPPTSIILLTSTYEASNSLPSVSLCDIKIKRQNISSMDLYFDESGTLTQRYCETNPYFIIAMVRPLDKDKLKRAYKRFIQENLDKLKRLDNGENKMFKDGKFVELKGSQFNREMRQEFVKYFARNNYFQLYYILVDNSLIKPHFCDNTARAFNYIIKLSLKFYFNKGLLPDEDYNLQFDERNEKTETKHFLENYLRTEFLLDQTLTHEIHVQYFDSADNMLVQVADVFANILYAHKRTNAYLREINYLYQNGYLKYVFRFPYDGNHGV
jgi:uncharacterized protein YciU (UPF0263 family)